MTQSTSVTAQGIAACPPTTRLMITEPGGVELITDRLPPLGPADVYAQAVVSGISHGTEMAWVRGSAAALHRSWLPKQRLYTAGSGRDYPVAPGYETIARVVAVGSAVGDRIAEGNLVALDRPHATGHVVSVDAAEAGRLPADVAPERAVFFILARVALGGVHDAGIHLGDTVVIVGLGTVGLIAGQLARLAGAGRVIGIDRYPIRLEAAESLGMTAIHADNEADVAHLIRKLTGSAGADVAIEASGSYAGLHEAIRCVRVGATVSTVASYHGDQGGLRLGEEYHRNRITLVSSMTVNGCPQRTHPAWDLPRLSATARQLVTDGQIRVDDLITHRIPFSDAQTAYELIDHRPDETIKVVLTYDR